MQGNRVADSSSHGLWRGFGLTVDPYAVVAICVHGAQRCMHERDGAAPSLQLSLSLLLCHVWAGEVVFDQTERALQLSESGNRMGKGRCGISRNAGECRAPQRLQYLHPVDKRHHVLHAGRCDRAAYQLLNVTTRRGKARKNEFDLRQKGGNSNSRLRFCFFATSDLVRDSNGERDHRRSDRAYGGQDGPEVRLWSKPPRGSYGNASNEATKNTSEDWLMGVQVQFVASDIERARIVA